MRDVRSRESVVDGRGRVSFFFKSHDQLLDPSDPSPKSYRELTEDAEDAIVSNVDVFRLKREVDIVLVLPIGSVPKDDQTEIREAVKHHFQAMISDLALERRSAWREGKVSLTLALVTLVVTISLVILLLQFFSSENLAPIAGFFTIINWVTIWDAFEYLIYDWRHLWRRKKILEKISVSKIHFDEWDPSGRKG